MNHKDLELEIRRQLLEGHSKEKVGAYLIHHVLYAPVSTQRKRTAINFLVVAGNWPSFLELMADYIKAGTKIPWSSFLLLCELCGFKPGIYFFKKLMQAFKASTPSATDLTMVPWEEKSPDIAVLKNQARKDLATQAALVKESLFDKLEFVRSNRMIDQEKEALDKLHMLFPEDSRVQQEMSLFKEKWARNVIQKRVESHVKFSLTQEPPPDPSEEEIIQLLKEDIFSKIKKDPKVTYNASILFYFVDRYREALHTLNQGPYTISSLWFKAELFYLNGRYIDCIDHLNFVNDNLSGNPETIFAVTYLKAQCFWKLGQINRAVEYVKSISLIRPNYRATQALLSEWSRGKNV